jgi:hypothetical protein
VRVIGFSAETTVITAFRCRPRSVLVGEAGPQGYDTGVTRQDGREAFAEGGEPVVVELLGVARLLARRETVDVPVRAAVSLAELTALVAAAAPALVGTVIAEDGALTAGYLFARGAELLRSPDDLVHPGQRLLLLSTSAGG